LDVGVRPHTDMDANRPCVLRGLAAAVGPPASLLSSFGFSGDAGTAGAPRSGDLARIGLMARMAAEAAVSAELASRLCAPLRAGADARGGEAGRDAGRELGGEAAGEARDPEPNAAAAAAAAAAAPALNRCVCCSGEDCCESAAGVAGEAGERPGERGAAGEGASDIGLAGSGPDKHMSMDCLARRRR
jgi:hypothetical protein